MFPKLIPVSVLLVFASSLLWLSHHWHHIFYTEWETEDLFLLLKNILLTVSGQEASAGSPVALAYASLFCLYLIPTCPSPPSLPESNLIFSYLHISKASPALHTIIIAPSPPLPHNPGHLSLSLPHLSISTRLGTAGVPLTTSLHWLLLMWNLPSGHLLDVRQRDTERDRQSVWVREGLSRTVTQMECSCSASKRIDR